MTLDRHSDVKFVSHADRYRSMADEAQKKLDHARSRLADLRGEEIELVQEAIRLEAQVDAYNLITEDLDAHESKEWANFFDVCGIQECRYRVLVEEGGQLSACAINLRLKNQGVDMDCYARPEEVIHSCLKRIPDRVRASKRKEPGELSTNVIRVYTAISAKPEEARVAKA